MASKVARNKVSGHGRERVQAASKTWHPRERNVVVVAVGYRCRIRSREHHSKRPQRARAERPPAAPYPNAKIGAFKHVARCPRSLPLLCYRFRKPLPSRPPSPGSRQDTAKTRPSHTNRSKELNPLRHRRLCSPSFPFFRARRSLRTPFAPCSLLTPLKTPLPIKQKPGL